MFLSVVILGGFTTEAHAMAHLITIDRPGDYSHHQTDATRRGPTIFDVDYFWGNSPGIDPAIQVRVTYLRAVPRRSPGQQKTHRQAQRRGPQTSPTRFTALPRHHNAPERVSLPGG